jgi:hypothetical protein
MEAGQALSSRLGRITISSEAIAQIVAETAAECYGVVAMKGSLRGRLAHARGRRRGSRSATTAVVVDLHVVVSAASTSPRSQESAIVCRYESGRLTGLPVRAGEVPSTTSGPNGK